uniref:Uncharacterized protein n=1 Tax=Amphimedon queenslandica TaxID=400682 RepID=A0A1X7UAS8_AMPQE
MQYSQPGTPNRLPPVDETGDDSATEPPHRRPPPPRREDRRPDEIAADRGTGSGGRGRRLVPGRG